LSPNKKKKKKKNKYLNWTIKAEEES
jgi:hypothetical protein